MAITTTNNMKKDEDNTRVARWREVVLINHHKFLPILSFSLSSSIRLEGLNEEASLVVYSLQKPQGRQPPPDL
jgi:hypothetical protein